ncbi:MAG: PadR family transcriptional regulator [Acidobacteriota bacterium]
MRKKKRVRRNRFPTDVAILQALTSGDAFGLEIKQRLLERTDSRADFGQSALYPALWKLVEDGLIKEREVVPTPSGGRPRIRYSLTAEGLRRAREDRIDAAGLFGLDDLQGVLT